MDLGWHLSVGYLIFFFLSSICCISECTFDWQADKTTKTVWGITYCTIKTERLLDNKLCALKKKKVSLTFRMLQNSLTLLRLCKSFLTHITTPWQTLESIIFCLWNCTQGADIYIYEYIIKLSVTVRLKFDFMTTINIINGAVSLDLHKLYKTSLSK